MKTEGPTTTNLTDVQKAEPDNLAHTENKSWGDCEQDVPNWKVREPGFGEGYSFPAQGENYRLAVGTVVFENGVTLYRSLSRILNKEFTKRITTTEARVVLTRDVLLAMPPELKDRIQTIIDLSDSGNPNLHDCFQVLLSRSEEESLRDSDLPGEIESIYNEYAQKPIDVEALSQLPSGYSLRMLDRTSDPDENLIGQYYKLSENNLADHLTFNGGPLKIIDNDNAIVLVCVKDTQVVGGVYAYRDVTKLSRNGHSFELNTYEILGAVVAPDQRDQKLYTAMSANLFKVLAGLDNPPVDMAFAYTNAEGPIKPTMRVAIKLGRIPTTITARELGIKITPSEAATDTVGGEVVQDVLTYIPGNKLRKNFGQLIAN